ncbi:hypothetical protein L596_007592 [Steinernema carpocapsae]|uniref:non-specific serine/threonine protein kinase n=1 Tax=Steinernema carpocapsae TaxID=34508 RepID=A0A4U5PA60_STECR|nr:hypothetical protein L596_007592 [Steinernema carpocapsae]
MPEQLFNSSAILGGTPEIPYFDQSWITKRTKRASQRHNPASVPGTPTTCPNSQRRFAQQLKRFNVVSKGKSTEEVMAKSSSYRRSSQASFFDQCFDVRGILGRGSFGEVLAVVSRDTGIASAIKRQLHPYFSNYDRETALREVRNFTLLPDHPNLLHLELAWEEKGLLYLQTELCVGNLEEYTRLYTLSELEVRFILKDLLKALAALHHCGLIHFDVKPENILISEDGMCKLGDFGLLFDMIKDQSGDFYHEGDCRYLDVYILERHHRPTPASDVFSLGLSILELATDLDLPGNGERWEDLRNGILPEKLISALSPDLLDMIRRMIVRDPAQRPSASELLTEPIMADLSSEQRPQFKPLPRPSMDKISSPPRKKPRRSARLQIKNNEFPSPFRTPPSSSGGSDVSRSRSTTPVAFKNPQLTPSPKLSVNSPGFPLTPTRVAASAGKNPKRRLVFGSPTTHLLSSC